ncbi:glycosyltransferase [Aeromicrobium wangtongii]|uniref:glycosyltransferase n=1 Tax=Aeromicrobium wangtongii TaxID=2969247 RepID=UPI002016ABF6|nr:glycosyltransferase family 2 protein [Aeromicrobium wangtongii]MCL3817235.1 glycosyltransferase family 2 protein [Aeromicrobium wangtongii]
MRIIGVTVTYGDRHAYCLDAVAAFFRNGIDEVVVISNGSSHRSLAALRASERTDPRLTVLHTEDNRGSAPAFAEGLCEALAREAEWVWILDDDNIPEDNALAEALHLVRSQPDPTLVAVSCVRDTDESHALLLSGVSPDAAFPPPGAFFGVDVLRRTRVARPPERSMREECIRLPQAPYGGLLLSRQAVEVCGLPRADFVLYFDDVEYTRRLVASGVILILAPGARIHDQGQKWADHRGRTYLDAMIMSADKRKIYYSYRNSTVTDWSRATSKRAKLRFAANWISYLAYVLVKSRLRNAWFSFLFIRAAIDAVRYSTSAPTRTPGETP